MLCHKGEPGHIYVAGNNWDANLAAESASLSHALAGGKISFLGVLTDEQLEKRMQKARPNPRPAPRAPRPAPHAPRPTPHAPRPTPHAPRPKPQAQV